MGALIDFGLSKGVLLHGGGDVVVGSHGFALLKLKAVSLMGL